MDIHQIKFHSFVDVITNSSTTIYIYQNSVDQAKALINEILKLMGEKLTAEECFHFGTFCKKDIYLDSDYEEIPEEADYDSPEYEESIAKRDAYIKELIQNILIGKIVKPSWMESVEESDDDYSPNLYLTILPIDERFETLGKRIIEFINSVSADGGYEG